MTGTDLAAHGRTVVQAALTLPQVCGEGATVGEVRQFFADDHVHAALVVDAAGVLLAVVERVDLTGEPDMAPAHSLGRLVGRTVAGDAPLAEVAAEMRASRRRRLAVVDDGGRLIGLLCMKRDFSGFCSDADVLARARDEGRRRA